MLMAMQAFEHPPAGLVQLPPAARRPGARSSSMPTRTPSPSPAACRRRRPSLRLQQAALPPALIEARQRPVHRHAVGAGRRRRPRWQFAAYLNCGWVCTSAERFYVHEDVYARFVEALARSRRGRCAWAAAWRSTRADGPARERERVEGVVAHAVAQGARIVCGGRRPPAPGAAGSTSRPCSLGPARDGDHARRVLRPAGAGVPRRQPDEAIARANDSRWAWGQPLHPGPGRGDARGARDRIRIVWVNTPLNDNDAVPFGDRKSPAAGANWAPRA